MTDAGGSVVGVVRSRSVSCGFRQHTCGNYKAHQANSPLCGDQQRTQCVARCCTTNDIPDRNYREGFT